MKIMFIIHSLDKRGGAETVLMYLVNHFAATSKHQVILTTLTNKNIILKLNKNIKLFRSTKYADKGKNNYLHIVYQIQDIKYAITNNQPDIIISFITGVNILTTIAAKLTNTPIIISERSSYDYGVNNKLWSLLRRYTYPFANTLVLPTNTEKNKYHYVKQIDIIPNPLKSLNQITNTVPREKLILAVGTLHFVKGFDMLIDAFNEANLDDWKLIILGEGVLREELEKQITKLTLNNFISMPGHTTDTEPFYRKASIFVLSSRSEGYPNVLCEAMSYGCASIAFDCPTGPKDIINHESNGLLVEAENIFKLSESISKLVKDKRLREEISNNAPNILEKLHINHISKLWEKSMTKVIKSAIINE